MSRIETAVFFGKGGIGKSTIASNVSALLAAAGLKVLHIGCDPKLDSTLSLAGRHIPPFNGSSGPDAEERLRGFIQPAAVKGVHCVEAGGPQAGVGCAGAGISALLEAIKGSRILEKDGYGAAVFDVLGDVVCGGFAAPLRRGFAKKVVIVTSEEPLSLYAANRLIMMTENFARNGVYLAGLAVNCRDSAGAALAEKFASAVNARVLAVIPRDPAVRKAERLRVPAAQAFPGSSFSRAVRRLSSAIIAAGPPKTPPRPLSDAEFGSFLSGRPPLRLSPSARKAAPVRGGAAAALRAANLEPTRLEGGQIVCDWRVAGGVRRIVIAPAGPGTAGRLQVSDWAACIHPTSDETAAGGETIKDAVAGLGGYKFEELLSYFGGRETFHAAVGALGESRNYSDTEAAGSAPRRPHLGSGQASRFIFPKGASSMIMPPDLAVAEHGDGECRFCETSCGPLGFFGGEGTAPPALPKGGTKVFSTGFGHAEALRGQEGLVKKALEAAARSAGPGGLVEFYSTCGPMLLAGDTAAAALDAQQKFGVKVLREDYNSYDEYSAAGAAARADLICSGLKRARASRPRARFDISFFNYPHLNVSLSAALAAAGLKQAPPGGFYETLARSRLILLPAYDAALCPALDRAGLKWLVPPAPYGFAGTRAWFSSIFKALGRAPGAAARPGPSQVKAYAALAAGARRFSAGLVVEASELALLAERYFLPLVAEAGFGIRLLVRAGNQAERKAAAAAAAALRKKLGARRLETVFFSGQEKIGARLARPAAMRLVYSDIRRDPRVLAAGKNPFGAALFEPGYDGAVESARRLLGLCEWDFSARYLAGRQ
jgi:nitrogenase subunit NifH